MGKRAAGMATWSEGWLPITSSLWVPTSAGTGIRFLLHRAAPAASVVWGPTDEPLAGLCSQGHGENAPCLLWKLAVDLWWGRKRVSWGKMGCRVIWGAGETWLRRGSTESVHLSGHVTSRASGGWAGSLLKQPGGGVVSGESPTKHAMHRPCREGRLRGHHLPLQELQRMEGSPNSPPLQIYSQNRQLDGATHWGFPGEAESSVH